jgi:hypothetical protein
VATGAGRVFVSDNADAPASAVTFSRIDNTAANSPGRFISGIYVDPANPHHAWISYLGYNVNTPAQPGHVFEVTWTGGAATWVDRSNNLPDLPSLQSCGMTSPAICMPPATSASCDSPTH